MPDRVAEPRRRAALPSWLMSLVLHLVLILLLGLTLRLAPPRGAAAVRTAEVGIVLKHQDGEDQYYEGQRDIGGDDSAATTATGSREELFAQPPPTDPSTALPSSLAVIGPAALEGQGVGTAVGAEKGPRGKGRWTGGKARTGVFGIEGEGYKFVYVLDRSASMEHRNAIEAAKAELIASLQSLEKTHQFQVIFYNDRIRRFMELQYPNKLFFATDRNKNLAAKFIGSITAVGITRHEAALLMAISLQPDVIFFLTDADQPTLSPGQLAKINRRAAGITINAIEFGFGPQSEPNNFLVKLARENGGRHGYVDISRLSPANGQ